MRNEPPPRRSGAMACHEGGKLEIDLQRFASKLIRNLFPPLGE